MGLIEGRWPLNRWTLRSVGSDGALGTADDFCIEGASTLAETARKAQNILEMLNRADASKRDALEGILELRCTG